MDDLNLLSRSEVKSQEINEIAVYVIERTDQMTKEEERMTPIYFQVQKSNSLSRS